MRMNVILKLQASGMSGWRRRAPVCIRGERWRLAGISVSARAGYVWGRGQATWIIIRRLISWAARSNWSSEKNAAINNGREGATWQPALRYSSYASWRVQTAPVSAKMLRICLYSSLTIRRLRRTRTVYIM